MKTPDTIHDSKLVTYFKLLKPEEYKDFRRFAEHRLPKNSVAFQLLDYCVAQYPAFEPTRLTKERIMYVVKITLHKKLEQCMYALLKVIEDYLAHQKLHQQPLEKAKLLASALAERGDYPTFEKYVQQETTATEMRIQTARNPVDSTDFLALYTLNEMLFFHPDTEKMRSVVDSLNKTDENLDKFYVLKKLRIISDLMIRQKFLSNQADIEVTYLVKLAENYAEPVFKLYIKLINLLLHHEDSLFDELLSNLKVLMQWLSPIDKTVFIEKLIFQANNIYEEGKIKYLQFIFELFQIADTEGVIKSSNSITYTSFINAVSVAAAVKESEWAKYFIKRYESFINVNIRKETVELAKIYCQFFEKQYGKALEKIEKLEKGQHLSIRLQAKTLRLRIFYELMTQDKPQDFYEEFDTHANNLIRFMDREENLIDAKKNAIKNFIRLLKSLIKYAQNPDRTKQDIINIKNKLLNTNSIIAKSWLLIKLEAFLPDELEDI